MTDEEIIAIRREALRDTRIPCNEYHDHSALKGCFEGDPKDITILKLVEVIRRERRIVREAFDKLEIEHPDTRALRVVCGTVGLSVESARCLPDKPPELTPSEMRIAQEIAAKLK